MMPTTILMKKAKSKTMTRTTATTTEVISQHQTPIALDDNAATKLLQGTRRTFARPPTAVASVCSMYPDGCARAAAWVRFAMAEGGLEPDDELEDNEPGLRTASATLGAAAMAAFAAATKSVAVASGKDRPRHRVASS